jgi:hypothetical protein
MGFVVVCFVGSKTLPKHSKWRFVCSLQLFNNVKAAEAATGTRDAPGDTTVATKRGRGKSLGNGERIRVLHSLLQRSAGDKLHRGTVALLQSSLECPDTVLELFGREGKTA